MFLFILIPFISWLLVHVGGGGAEPPESTVQEIVQMGFARDQVIFELRRFNGDKTQAIAALIAKSLKF